MLELTSAERMPATVGCGVQAYAAGVTVEVVGSHVHEWTWTRSGRVPGVLGRWREYVCPCGESKRVDQ